MRLLISHLVLILAANLSLAQMADVGTQQSADKLPLNATDGPSSIAIVDLNRDSRPELVVTNRVANTVSVLLNNGLGSFTLKSRYATGVAPSALAAADLNRDGKQDIVVANAGSNSVSVFLGNGDGLFTRGKDFPTGAVPSAIVTANLNRDNVIDLVVVNRYGNSVSVLLGRGDGSFAPRADYSSGRLPYSIAITDVNHDGASDLLVTSCFDNVVSMLQGNVDGSFRPGVPYATAKRSCGAVIGKIDPGGGPGVIEAHRYGYLVSIQLIGNDGAPKFQCELLSGKGPRSVTAADFNGDRVTDLAVANAGHRPGETGSVFVFLGTGGGAFEAKTNYVTGNASHSIADADLNGDGKLDIAVLNGSLDFGGSVSVMFGNGDGTFVNRVDYATGGYLIWVSFGEDTNPGSERVKVEKPPDKP
jgi:hypothetical protein